MYQPWIEQMYINAVDGRNPAPVDRWFIPLFTRGYTSKVVQDFFHQQYVAMQGVWANSAAHRSRVIGPTQPFPIIWL